MSDSIDPFTQLSKLYSSAMAEKSILLAGYNALIEKLLQPGNIDKKELTTLIVNYLAESTKI